MKYKNKNTVEHKWIIPAGPLIAIVVTIVCTAIMALLVVNENISESSTKYIIQIVHLLSAFAGSYITGKRITDNLLVTSIISSAIYCLLLTGITILFFDGLFKNVFIGIGSVSAGTVLGVILNLRRKSNISGRKRKIRTC